MYRTLSAPLMIQWEVTPDCNHNCVHCFNHWRTKEGVEVKYSGYEHTNGEAITQEIISNGVFAVNITGGEPLLVIEQIAPFLEKLSNNNVQVTMNSNLTLLTRKRAQLLKKCGVESILVSIPSGNANTCDIITGEKDSLGRIVRGISFAKEAGIRIFTNMVVSRVNKEQIKETARLIASLNLKHFAVTKASDPSENKDFTSEMLGVEEFHQMQKTLEDMGEEFGLRTNSLEANPACAYGGKMPKQGYKFCSAGKTTCTIGFDGVVKPCNRVNMPYGHISDGLRNCWLMMEDWRTDVWVPKVCMRCHLKSVCVGGCKANALKTFGDITREDPLYTTTSVPQVLKTVKDPPTSNAKVFKINRSLIQRREEFGSILFLSLSRWVAVNHALTSLIKGKEVVARSDIARALSVDNDNACATINVLVQRGVLSELK